MVAVSAEYQGKQSFYGDYAYWVGRDGMGYVRGFRQLLNGEKRPDAAQPREHLVRAQLPSDELRREYDVLMGGGIPSELFRADPAQPVAAA